MVETQKKIETNKFTGIVDRILFKNKDNGYHILGIETNNDSLKNTTVTINHPNIFEGFTYEFTGEWSLHPKFGNQFKATEAQEVLPSTTEGLKSYLASSFFPGIGPVIAGKIINHFGSEVMNVFNNDLNRLLSIPGISKRKLEAIKDSWEKNKEINDVMMFLRQHNISNLYAKKIYEFYGKNCVSQILKNPYILVKDISGIGFLFADRIALQIGFSEESLERLQACINYILEQGSNDGHCYLYEHQIISKSSELLKLQLNDIVKEAIGFLDRSGEIKIITTDTDKNKRYYSKKLYYNEKYCAEKIHLLKENSSNIKIHQALFDKINVGIVLSEEQKKAVIGVVGSGVSVLTGGPGTGKSTTTKKILELFESIGKTVSMCAPTGRAAQRILQVTGSEASTIHRLLSWDPANGGFLKNENNTIESDVIIVDESSMIDVNLASSLLRAISSKSQVVFIGDSSQIFPIGPGTLFKDIIDSEIVPIFKLKQIFRQGKESLIVKYAHEINNGEIPNIETPLIDPKLWENKNDCLFIDSGMADPYKNKNEYPKWSSLRYGLSFEDTILKIYTETIPKFFGADKEIQILIPMNVGDIGNIRINKIIQNKINPHSKNKSEIKINDKIFRTGDKVIQTKNNYDLGAFNGDIGKILSINELDGYLIVKFSEDREIVYKKTDMFDLDLGYTISVHKAQGSEFDCVILPIMPQYTRMLSRALVYTALTRGKKLCVFIGQRKSLEAAINNNKSEERQTSLVWFLKNEMPI